MELHFIFNSLSRVLIFSGSSNAGGLFLVGGGSSDNLYQGSLRLTVLGMNIGPHFKGSVYRILVVLQLRHGCRENGVCSFVALDASGMRRAVDDQSNEASS